MILHNSSFFGNMLPNKSNIVSMRKNIPQDDTRGQNSTSSYESRECHHWY